MFWIILSWLMQENYHFFLLVNAGAGRVPLLDALMIFCANDLIFALPMLLLVLWGRPGFLRRRALRPGEAEIITACREAFLWSIGAILLAVAFNMGLSHLIFEPRPFVSHRVHLLVSHPADDSFPSDHAAVSFAVAGMLLFTVPAQLVSAWKQRVLFWRAHNWHRLLLPLLVMGLALMIACCIGIARVFVGVHYPGDIVGGALSGMSAAGTIIALRRPLHRPTEAFLHVLAVLHLT
jgi:undecaprenyl-diphosphatase